MDGLGRILASPTAVRVGGRSYWCRALDLRGWGAIENHLLAGRQSPGDAVWKLRDRPKLYDALRAKAEAEIRADKWLRVVGMDDSYRWAYTPEGVAFTAWYCVRKCPAVASPEDALWHFAEQPDDAQAFVRVRDKVSGLDLLSVCDWPADPVHPVTGKPLQKTGPKFAPWKKMLRDFAEGRNWPPGVVGRLTLYQLRVYCASADQSAGTAQIDRKELAAVEKMSRKERVNYVLSRGQE